MQSINQLTDNLTTLTNSERKSQLSTAPISSQEILEPSVQLLEMMTNMFEDWKRVFGSKLKDRQSIDLRTAELWSIALQQLKITPKEFKVAMQKSITLEWPPTAPADFLELGRGKIADNYPEVRQAYIDQANRKTECPIAYETARRIGFGFIREQPEAVSYPMWQKIYKEVCIEHSQGREFTKPQVPQIEVKKHTEAADDAIAAEYLRNIRALLAGDTK